MYTYRSKHEKEERLALYIQHKQIRQHITKHLTISKPKRLITEVLVIVTVIVTIVSHQRSITVKRKAPTLALPKEFHPIQIQISNSVHRKPSHTHDDIQPPLLPAGVLERPHAVAVDVPEGARGRVHPALADVDAVFPVDDALLHDRAVDGEAVGRGGGGVGGGGGGDEGFEDVVL